MKSMIALALAGVVAMSTPVLVDAANINASKYAAAYGTYNGMKLNEGVTIYANAPKSVVCWSRQNRCKNGSYASWC